MRLPVQFLKSSLMIAVFSVVLSACSLVKKEEVAGLQITTEGSTASVFLNGQFSTKTPFNDQKLKPGKYTVRLEPEVSGLSTYETSVTVYPGTIAVMNWQFGATPETSGGTIFEMEPLKKKGSSALSIVSIPDGTIVKVDDASQGFTPVLMSSITAGAHKVQITLPSYKPQEETLNVVEGFQMNVTVKLSKDKTILEKKAETSEAEIASDSAQEASSTAKKDDKKTTPTPTPKVSPVVKDQTAKKPYVEILNTGTGWLRVRDKADASGKELAKVDTGKTYPYVETEAGWHLIEYEDGEEGWVSAQYAKVVK